MVLAPKESSPLMPWENSLRALRQVFSNARFSRHTEETFLLLLSAGFPCPFDRRDEGEGPFEGEDMAAHRGLGKEEIIAAL